ncbi:hypothetical protein ACTPDT_11590 [Clostridioides difficile]|uniref:hypothetical protein n=1 Tax=Clostridioides difficile TaxID=1496 RepID=UPI000872DBD1|nr:hypothetical protein [Clostridioides difficile]MCI4264536.1 hypothetical protein [Clostridioides difficile]MCK1951708.1 hypothetical protein [Clostridioides difficile]MCK1954614.1 hypothetical protein [Clostridioides difficile]MCM3858892.1 hypothetical protein [Clostridioides difficile]MCV2268285.1 hypothetical protein [Clostridioides difficile]
MLTKKYFSTQTQKQIDIGIKIAEMATEDELLMNSVFSLIKQIINRDEGWKEYYANEMNSINEEKMKIIYMKDIQMNLN